MRGRGILLDKYLDLAIKPVLDGNGKIVSGLQLGNTLYQNQALILTFYPGAVKLSPVVGVGFNDVLFNTDFLSWKRRIRQQMELDGQKIKRVVFSNTEQLIIDGEYSNS